MHRFVSNEAEFLQKSVYKLSADKKSYEKFVLSLENLICSNSDDIRIYPLFPQAKFNLWGKHRNSFGVHILG